MARITLWGFYQFTDRKLFDNIQLYSEFDKQILVDLIMQQSGELFPFHQQPDYLKRNIENWFARMYEQFKRMYDALYAEYNPLENYDRHEDWSDSESTSISESESTSMSESESTSTSESESISASGSSHDSSSDSTSNSLQNDISAANMTTGFLPDSASNGTSAGRSISDTNNTNASSRNNKGATIRNNAAATLKNNLHDSKHYSEHGGHIHGNIGVTTNVQMISGELELRKFDIYETIANMFEEEFIVRVY